MFNLQGWDWLIIFMIVLLLFGAKKIPEIMRGFGKGLNEFKKAKDGIADTLEDSEKETTPQDAAEKKDNAPSEKKQ